MDSRSSEIEGALFRSVVERSTHFRQQALDPPTIYAKIPTTHTTSTTDVENAPVVLSVDDDIDVVFKDPPDPVHGGGFQRVWAERSRGRIKSIEGLPGNNVERIRRCSVAPGDALAIRGVWTRGEWIGREGWGQRIGGRGASDQ